MERVSLDELANQPHPMDIYAFRGSISDAIGAEDVAVIHYELEPGDSFSGGIHTHHDQEEIFLVREGEATFDVGPDGDEQVPVRAGEAIRFAPGEFQHGRNATDDRVVGLVIGAPGRRHDWSELESFMPCPACEEETSHGVHPPDDTLVVYCQACGHETRVA